MEVRPPAVRGGRRRVGARAEPRQSERNPRNGWSWSERCAGGRSLGDLRGPTCCVPRGPLPVDAATRWGAIVRRRLRGQCRRGRSVGVRAACGAAAPEVSLAGGCVAAAGATAAGLGRHRSLGGYGDESARPSCGPSGRRASSVAAGAGSLLVRQASDHASPAGGSTRSCPCPCTGWRRACRGTSAADELARPVAAVLGLPCRRRACARSHGRRGCRTNFRFEERAANVRGAFRVRAARSPAAGVLLIDDVTTTGSTLAEPAAAPWGGRSRRRLRWRRRPGRPRHGAESDV